MSISFDYSAHIALAQSLYQQSHQNEIYTGVYRTAHPLIHLIHQISNAQFAPQLYEPSLIFLLSGAKHAQIGQYSYQYQRGNVLVVTSSYPMQCCAYVDDAAPLMGLYVRLDRAMVKQLLEQVDRLATPPLSISIKRTAVFEIGIEVLDVNHAVLAALYDVLARLNDVVEQHLFVDDALRRLVYLLIQHPESSLLRQWAYQQASFAKLDKALRYIEQHYAQAIDINTLTSISGMSASSLNRAFKQYTTDAPLQYLKKIRLNIARHRLSQTQCSVQQAAFQVGYTSVSQFSREFKRYFGYSPKAVV